LTAGQAHDLTQAASLLDGIKTEAVVTDKAFDANALIQTIEQTGAKVVIPPKADRTVQRDFDRNQYKHRNLIERFFCRLKHFRRIATRYDKLASRFSSFIALVASFIWLAHLPSEPSTVTRKYRTVRQRLLAHGRIGAPCREVQ
jgi:transposase